MPEFPNPPLAFTSVATLTLATELVIGIIPYDAVGGAVNIDQPQVGQAAINAIIRGVASIATIASGTGGTIKCYRTTVAQAIGAAKAGAPPQVGSTLTVTQPASVSTTQPFSFVDTNNPTPQQGWFLTYTASGANATLNAGGQYSGNDCT